MVVGIDLPTVPQAIFGLALLAIAGLISIFSLYVISTTVWGNRWFRKPGTRRVFLPWKRRAAAKQR